MRTIEFKVKKGITYGDAIDDVLEVLAEKSRAGEVPTWSTYDVEKREQVQELEQYWITLHPGPIENQGPAVASVYVAIFGDEIEVEVAFEDIVEIPGGERIDLLEEGLFIASDYEIQNSTSIRFFGNYHSPKGEIKKNVSLLVVETYDPVDDDNALDVGWVTSELEI